MQHCDFHGRCLLGGIIRPGQAKVMVQDSVAHLACSIGIGRQLQHFAGTANLTPEEREEVYHAVKMLERAVTMLDLTDTGSLLLDERQFGPAEGSGDLETDRPRRSITYLN